MSAVLALSSSFLWGIADFLGGTASRRRPAVAVYVGSQVPAFVLLAVIATVTGSWSADPAFWPWAIAAGLLGMVGLVSFYTALATGTMGIVAPAGALAVIVPLTVGLLRGEEPAPLQILGIVLAIVGVVLASGPELSDAASTRPVLLALLSALTFGLMFVAMAEASVVSALMMTTGMRGTTMVVGLALVLARRSLGGLRRGDVPVLTAIGISDAGANVSWGLASATGLLSVSAVLGSLYPVVTAVLAAAIHHERLRAVQYAGVAVTLVGVVLISAGG